MEQQINNFHSRKISISDILRSRPFPSIKTCLVQEADQKVLGGLTSKLLMVGLWVHAMFYHYPQFVQVIFGLWNAFTVIRLCEEGKSAALPRKPPTLGWRTTWGQSTQGSLWRWSVSSPMEALLPLTIGQVYREKSLIRSFSCPHGKFWPWMAVEWCFVNTISKWWLKKKTSCTPDFEKFLFHEFILWNGIQEYISKKSEILVPPFPVLWWTLSASFMLFSLSC